MTIEEAQKSYRCHAVVLDRAGMPVRNCRHDHGIEPHAAALCALDLGWNGAAEFKIRDGESTDVMQRFEVSYQRGSKHIRAL